jgi:hypothetical protein
LEIHDDSDPAKQKSFVDFAVSNNDQPASSRDFAEIHRVDIKQSNGKTNLWGDFPKFGWNADAYVFTVNMFAFPASGENPGGFDHVQIITIDKSSVLDANPNTLTVFSSNRPSGEVTFVPATMHESSPGDPMWFVESEGFVGGNTIRLVQMTNVLSPNPNFNDFIIPVPA